MVACPCCSAVNEQRAVLSMVAFLGPDKMAQAYTPGTQKVKRKRWTQSQLHSWKPACPMWKPVPKKKKNDKNKQKNPSMMIVIIWWLRTPERD